MSDQAWLSWVERNRAIAVIRANQPEIAYQMALSVAAGGMQLIEITWNTKKSVEVIRQLRSELPELLIGTGTLLNMAQLQSAIACGAQFLFTPHVDIAMIKTAVDAKVPIIPGALTPTEIVTAWNAGASCVKVFPVQAVGGANYIQSLQAPLGKIPLIPTGGVTLDNAKAFIDAGAIAVGVASDLFPQQLVVNQDWDAIAQRARTLIEMVNDYIR
ncbi:MAG: bifunctional 4-hydroxy-2-oxoglutarate aldolase/2-dehydro-3-deoxy-phosphogluconate aldolase [Crinalium sp.]